LLIFKCDCHISKTIQIEKIIEFIFFSFS
jgi:hypothetical protein